MPFFRRVFFVFLLAPMIGLAQNRPLAKFEPGPGECLVFVGQDLAAVGGLDEYPDGYVDHFETPAGITVYTSLSPGQNSYGYINRGVDGMTRKANWGAGDSHAQAYLEDPDFQHTLIAIGLSFVDHEKQVAKGKHDRLLRQLGRWIKDSGRPVFLRIGYEFDGWDWNHYQRKWYLKAWERIHQTFADMGIDNVAFVWQSKGWGTDQATLEKWYPGDDLVDWCAYSYFGDPDRQMLIFAERHQKPVFLAEATPVMQTDNLYFNTDLQDPEIARRVWEAWFEPFFQTLDEYRDLIKAFSYINADWPSQPMWQTNPTFRQVDARLQVSDYVSQRWRERLADKRFLHATPELRDRLRE